MIKLQAIGNLGGDATIKEVNSKKVINFSVAHTEKVRDVEKTIWLSCSLWEREALAPYLKKGMKVYVSGAPSLNTYTTGPQMDQKTVAELKLTVFEIELLTPKQQ